MLPFWRTPVSQERISSKQADTRCPMALLQFSGERGTHQVHRLSGPVLLPSPLTARLAFCPPPRIVHWETWHSRTPVSRYPGLYSILLCSRVHVTHLVTRLSANGTFQDCRSLSSFSLALCSQRGKLHRMAEGGGSQDAAAE